MGTASEQSLRNILSELESDTLPTDAATQTTLALCLTQLQSLLTELQLKADLTETQPVSAASLPLPASAATAANQSTEITALQLIDNLVGALGSVNTDDIQVDVKTMPTVTIQSAGGDKIFALESAVAELVSNTNLAAGTNTLDTTAVPASKLHVITQIAFMYAGSSPTEVSVRLEHGATETIIWNQLVPVTLQYYDRQGAWVLAAGDYMRARVTGATLGNDLYLGIIGYQMDAPS